MEQNLKAKVIIFIKNAFLYEIQNDSKREIARGDLKVLQLKKEKIYLMSIGSFNYSLSKDLSVMRSTRDQYVFPMFNGFLGVIIPENTPYELLETFEAILEETTDFTISNHRRASQHINRSQTFDLEAVKTAETTSKTRKLSLLLEQGGEQIKKGIVRAATFTSEGIKKGSEYLKTKIKKKDKPLEVSDQQISTIKHLKTATSIALMVSKALVVGAIATTKEIGHWVSERFEESDTSKKLERSPAYHIAKDIGKAGLSAAVTVYDGLEEALIILGKSSAEATVDLIDHKYGPQAGNASEEATKVLSNVGGIYQESKKVAITNLAKITAKETAKNVLNDKK